MNQQIEITLTATQLDEIFKNIFEKLKPDYTFTDYRYSFNNSNGIAYIKLCGLKEVKFNVKSIL